MSGGGGVAGYPAKSLKSLGVAVSRPGGRVMCKPLINNDDLRGGGVPLSIDKGACDAPLSDQLKELAHRVRYLSQSHRDPEAFHLAKSDIEAELRRLAHEVNHG